MSHKDLHNPQAFPGTDARGFVSVGMSLRDYFAGQAIVGMSSTDNSMHGRDGKTSWYSIVSKRAYELADVMLAERDKEQ